MTVQKDTFKTIVKPSPEVLFKDRGSKFIGYAFPVTSEEEIKEHLRQLKKSITTHAIGAMPGNLANNTKNTALMMTESPLTVQVCPFTVNYNPLM